jgi:hypothetical protein
MKFSRPTLAKARRTREHPKHEFSDSAFLARFRVLPFPHLHRRLKSIGFPARSRAQWRIVMRYRSATVAGFNGVPRILRRDKERANESGISRRFPGWRNGIFCAR